MPGSRLSCRPVPMAVAVALLMAMLSGRPCSAGQRDKTRTAKLSAPRTPAEITDAHVQRSISYGIKYLKSIQGRNGRIGVRGKSMNFTYPVGQTALGLLAMIEGGTPLEDPRARAAFTYITETPTDHTYGVALISMVLAKLPKDKMGRSKRRAMENLMRRFVSAQAADGMWTYWLLDPRKVPAGQRRGWGRVVGSSWRKQFVSGDNSNTQFAVLALWEMAKRGVEIPRHTLNRAAEHFLRTQTAGGGWSYILNPERFRHPEQHPTMNATGLASLYILRDLLGQTGEGLFDGVKSPECGEPGRYDKAIEHSYNRVVRDLGVTNGLIWLFGGPPFRRSGYYSYAIERVGAASGHKQIGDHDWYREGAWYFLRNQQKDGSWTVGYNQPIETSFAILFMAKARAPFIIHKLHWRGDWNKHTRDAANFVRYAENTFEQRFRWQIVDLAGKTEEWLEAPILFISGHESPRLFDDEEKKKLRQFVEDGGTILADNCCQVKEFDEGFRKLMKAVFPEAELRQLEPDHKFYTSHFKLKPVRTHPVLGLDIAARGYGQASPTAGQQTKPPKPLKPRTVVFYCPWTIGCVWNQDLKTNHDRVYQTGINVFRYATAGTVLKRPLDGTSKTIPVPGTPREEAPLPRDQRPELQ